MKTLKNIFPEICSFPNLLRAAYLAGRGKRDRMYVIAFFQKLENNLLELRNELEQQAYQPGSYTTFQIYKPKPRLISAAPFRDRVVHHALMNIIAPPLEKSFIFDSYANRVGKGTHQAIRRYQNFLRKYPWVLKCDIRKYFPTIDHEILKGLFCRCIADQQVLWLIDTIIDGSNEQMYYPDYFSGDNLLTVMERRTGLPIGNLTSQFFANFYLDPLDHFIKEQLRCKAYIRYVDDFVLFGQSKQELWKWHNDIVSCLERLRLRLNPTRVHLYPSSIQYPFLGQVISRSCRRLKGENVRRFRRNVNKWQKNPPENVEQRIAAWSGHAAQANSRGLLKSLGVGLPEKDR